MRPKHSFLKPKLSYLSINTKRTNRNHTALVKKENDVEVANKYNATVQIDGKKAIV